MKPSHARRFSTGLLVAGIALGAAPRAADADLESSWGAALDAAPPRAKVEEILDLRPTLDALAKKGASGEPEEPELEAMRSAARARVLAADAEISIFVARIEQERDQVLDLSRWYDDRTSARVTRLTIAGGIFAIGAAVGTAMTLNSHLVQSGTWVTTIASGVGALLTLATILQIGDSAPVGIDDNVLGPLFGTPTRTPYPPFIARVTAVAHDASLARPFVARWRAMGWLPEPPKDRELVRFVASPARAGRTMDPNALMIRSRLLLHLRSEFIELHGALRAILTTLVRST